MFTNRCHIFFSSDDTIMYLVGYIRYREVFCLIFLVLSEFLFPRSCEMRVYSMHEYHMSKFMIYYIWYMVEYLRISFDDYSDHHTLIFPHTLTQITTLPIIYISSPFIQCFLYMCSNVFGKVFPLLFHVLGFSMEPSFIGSGKYNSIKMLLYHKWWKE